MRIVRLSLQMLVTGEAGLKDVSGPVGIVSTITDVGEQAESTSAAVENIAYLAALVAVNLAVMNMLPIPPLDGGKLLIEIIQKIAGRELPLKVQTIVSYVGVALFALLFVYMLRSDILRLIL